MAHDRSTSKEKGQMIPPTLEGKLKNVSFGMSKHNFKVKIPT